MSARSAKLFALLLLLLFPSSILWWHLSDSRPSSMDETRHMQLAIDYRNFLAHGVPLTNEWSHVYPPLYHLSIIPALSVGIPSETKVAMSYFFYLLALLTSCILFSRQAKRPDWEGVLAAFLCVGYCYVFWASRRALVDFPLMAWTTLTMALLFRTDGFSSLRASLLWGAAAGLGLLIKAPFLFFSIGPVLWVVLTSRQPRKTGHMLAALGLCAAICAPWYFWQSAYFLLKGFSLAAEKTGNTDPRNLSGWLYYFRALRPQVGIASLAFTLIGMGLAFIRKRTEGNGLLVAWILSGYLTLSLLVNKDLRHTLPLLPAMAILAARGWGNIAAGRWSPFILSAVGPLLMIFNMSTYDLPGREDWKHAPIISLMTQLHDPALPFLSASILSHQPRFFSRTLKWSAFQEGVPLRPVSPGDSDTSFPEYVITRPGDQGSETATLEEQWQDLGPGSRAFTSLFSVCGRFPLPDHSEAIVYRRDPHPHYKVSPLTREELERRIALALREWVAGPVTVSVEASPEGLQEGHLDRVRISCRQCSVKGLPIQDIDVVAEKPWLNLYRLWDENHLGLIAFESLKPTCKVTAEGAKAMLSKVKGISQYDVQFVNGKVRAQARFNGIPVGAVAHLSLNQSRYPGLEAVLDTIYVGGIPLPGWLLGKVHRQTLILYPIPDFPGRILINRITTDHGELVVS